MATTRHYLQIAVSQTISRTSKLELSWKKYENKRKETDLKKDELYQFICQEQDGYQHEIGQMSLLQFSQAQDKKKGTAIQTKMFYFPINQILYYTQHLRMQRCVSSYLQTNKGQKLVQFSSLVEKFRYNPQSDENEYCFVLDCDIEKHLKFYGFSQNQDYQKSFEKFKEYFIEEINDLCQIQDAKEHVFFTRYPGYVYKNKFSTHIYVQCIRFVQTEVWKIQKQNINVMKAIALHLHKRMKERYSNKKEDIDVKKLLLKHTCESIFDLNIYDNQHLKSVFSSKTSYFDMHIPDQIPYFGKINIEQTKTMTVNNQSLIEQELMDTIQEYQFNQEDYEIFKKYFVQYNSQNTVNHLEEIKVNLKKTIEFLSDDHSKTMWKSTPVNIQIFFNQIQQLVKLDSKFCEDTYYWKKIIGCFSYIYKQEKQMQEENNYFGERTFDETAFVNLLVEKIEWYSCLTRKGKEIFVSEHGQEYAFQLMASPFSNRISPYYLDLLLQSYDQETNQICPKNSFFQVNDSQIDKYLPVIKVNEQYISNIVTDENDDITNILTKSYESKYNKSLRQMITFILSQPKTGKSYLFRRVLEKCFKNLNKGNRNYLTALVLTSSQTLAIDLENQINNDDKDGIFNVVNYMDLNYDFETDKKELRELRKEEMVNGKKNENEKEKLKEELTQREIKKQEFFEKTLSPVEEKINIVICGVLSLGHLSSLYQSDVIIIDEICKFNMQLCSKDFQTERLLKNTPRLQELLEDAQKVICLDGYLSWYDIFIFCEKMFPSLTEYEIYQNNRVNIISNSYNPFSKTNCTVMNNQEDMVGEMRSVLKQDEESVISVCVDNITLGNYICERFQKYNPFFVRKDERVIESCKTEEEKEITMKNYKQIFMGFMKSKDNEKVQFLRQQKIRVLVYSPKITVGINIYGIKHCFAFYKGTIHPKDCLQQILRNRDMETLHVDIQQKRKVKKFHILNPHEQYSQENIDFQDLFLMLSVFKVDDQRKAKPVIFEIETKNYFQEFKETTCDDYVQYCKDLTISIPEENNKSCSVTYKQFRHILEMKHQQFSQSVQYKQSLRQLEIFMSNYIHQDNEDIIRINDQLKYVCKNESSQRYPIMLLHKLLVDKCKQMNSKLHGEKKLKQQLTTDMIFEKELQKLGYVNKLLIEQLDIQDVSQFKKQITEKDLMKNKKEEEEQLNTNIQQHAITKIYVSQEIQANKLLYTKQIRKEIYEIMQDDFCPLPLIIDYIQKNISMIKNKILETSVVSETIMFKKLMDLFTEMFQDEFETYQGTQDGRMAPTKINKKYGKFTGKQTVYKVIPSNI